MVCAGMLARAPELAGWPRGTWSIFELIQGAGKMARADDLSMPEEVKCKQGMILRFW
jgi:hypothetical protein